VGIPYAPITPAYSLVAQDFAKLGGIVEVLRPGAIFAGDGDAFADAIAAVRPEGCAVITDTGGPEDAVRYADLGGAGAEAEAARRAVGAQTVAKYLFTSGSTGSPKAVINTNGMICAMEAMVRDCYRFAIDEPPVILDWAPWNHTAGGNKVFYFAMTNGGTYYIDDGRPTAKEFAETLRNLKDVRPTWYFNVPIGFDMLVEAMEADEALAGAVFERLNMLFYAGAGMAQHTWDRLSAIGARITGRPFLLATGLGATETAPFALACTDVQDRAGNVGVPARGLTLKLVPTGGKLEARLKGPSITPGYLGDPAKTAEAFDDEGFYCMGDALRPADPDDFAKGFFFDGRVAENFKLSTGTWVAVGAVRTALVDALGGLARDAVIVGENEAQLGAIVVPSEAAEAMTPEALRAEIEERMRAAARAATGSASRVRRAMVLTRAPSFDRGEVTEKGSLNQRAMRQNCAAEIAALYAGDPAAIIV